ncbi:MAG: hypothetical protein J0L78_05115 [Planctomycetes bacterium]|nr:hypothetical protein [Planctomycetota bacterium]
MRQLLGVLLIFWAGFSAWLAYQSVFAAAQHRLLGWSYIEYPLRIAFGEQAKSSDQVDRMWGEAIENVRVFDPGVTNSQIGLTQYIASGIVESASLNYERFAWTFGANSLLCLIAGILLIRAGPIARAPITSAT